MNNNIKTLIEIGRKCGIKPLDKLAAGGIINQQIKRFFKKVEPFWKMGIITLDDIAQALDCLGAQSARGHIISRSHVSNTFRKSITKTGPKYSKKNYKGKNHSKFDSQPTPLKTVFATIA